jgi:hypothetical protein
MLARQREKIKAKRLAKKKLEQVQLPSIFDEDPKIIEEDITGNDLEKSDLHLAYCSMHDIDLMIKQWWK